MVTLARRVAKMEAFVYTVDSTIAQMEDQLRALLFQPLGQAAPKRRPGKKKDSADNASRQRKSKSKAPRGKGNGKKLNKLA